MLPAGLVVLVEPGPRLPVPLASCTVLVAILIVL